MKRESDLAKGWLQKGVTQELLDMITQKIVQVIHPKKIILFGSYAWGNPSVDSDVDLFVIVDASDEPGYRRARSVYAVWIKRPYRKWSSGC